MQESVKRGLNFSTNFLLGSLTVKSFVTLLLLTCDPLGVYCVTHMSLYEY